MNPAIKQKWVAALRSGDYKQTRGKLGLRDTGDGTTSHCCLGVLCEVVGLPKKQDSLNRIVYDGAISFLSFSAGRQFGISDVTCGKLIAMNDSEHLPFSEIADWIEANL